MRKLSYCLTLFFLSVSFAFAQDVIYRINGDSLVGRMDFAKDALGLEYITIGKGRNKQSVKLVEVRMIKTKRGDIIRPVEFGGKYKFGKQVSIGYLSYYKISNDDSPEMFTDDLLTKMNGEFLVISGNIGFKGRVSRYLEDCTQVSYDVRQKKYGRGRLTDIVDDYNVCVDKNGLLSEEAIELEAQQLRLERAEAKKQKLTKSLEDKLKDFTTLLEYTDKVSNKDDVTAMFNDLAGKLRRKEKIPEYLKNGLTAALTNDPQLTKLLQEILKKEK